MTTVSQTLFSPLRLGPVTLPNRVVMAPMTRCRSGADRVPTEAMAVYYGQRSSASLMITEASQVSPQGIGYVGTPGMYTEDMVEGWKRVTDTVHAAGGRIFLQLWHVGRNSHPEFLGGELPVAPSAIGYEGEVHTPSGEKSVPTPRALGLAEISGVIEQFAHGARNAKRAGFDGVEIHGANGYLIDQFTRDGSNLREDAYGGSIQARCRFAVEVTEAVIAEIGADRVGFRINPLNLAAFGMSDSDPSATYSHLVHCLSALGIAYLHLLEPLDGHQFLPQESFTRLAPTLRSIFDGVFMLNGGYDADSAARAIESGSADLISFGVPFLANPDLPLRFRLGLSLNQPDPETFYMGGDRGHIDYPAYTPKVAHRELDETQRKEAPAT